MHVNDCQAAALARFLGRQPPPGGDDSPVIIFRATPGEYLDHLKGRPVQCFQTCKPPADELARLGFDPVAEPRGPVGLAIVFATKHREEVLYHIARAATLLDEGGTLIVSAANDLGAGSLEKQCAGLFGGVATYSKHKCRVFAARKDSVRLDPDTLERWHRAGEWVSMPGTGLFTRPGLFSWKSVDPGSRLLAENLPDDLAGRGADLGAGYGYLSRELLARSHRITELHLFEAERNALEAAQINLAGRAGHAGVHFHWADVTAGLPVRRFHFVVMNPPFHAGREAVSALGRAFVRVAMDSLKTGGWLYLVANRRLPYEGEIQAMAGRVDHRVEGGGFKVIRAAKL